MEADLSPFSGRVVQAAFSVPLSGSLGDGSGVSVSQPVPQGGILHAEDFRYHPLPHRLDHDQTASYAVVPAVVTSLDDAD